MAASRIIAIIIFILLFSLLEQSKAGDIHSGYDFPRKQIVRGGSTLMAVGVETLGGTVSPEDLRVIEQAQEVNVMWLACYGRCRNYWVKYRYSACKGVLAGVEWQDPAEYEWADSSTSKDYEGPFNRGIRFTDPAELIIYAGAIGSPFTVTVQGVNERTMRGILRGEEAEWVAGILFGNGLRCGAQYTYEVMPWFFPASGFGADVVDYQLTLDSEYRLIRCEYHVLRKGSSLHQAKIVYEYSDGDNGDGPPYPVHVAAATVTHPPIAIEEASESITTMDFQMAENMWICRKATKLVKRHTWQGDTCTSWAVSIDDVSIYAEKAREWGYPWWDPNPDWDQVYGEG